MEEEGEEGEEEDKEERRETGQEKIHSFTLYTIVWPPPKDQCLVKNFARVSQRSESNIQEIICWCLRIVRWLELGGGFEDS